MKAVGIYEARTKFAELINQAGNGDTIVVTRKGRPVAELRPVSSRTPVNALVDEILALDWTLGASIVGAIRKARDERG